jgi:hypothetical protein
MRIPYRQHWLLRRMNRSLCRSDPHLAAMLAIFARLNAGEVISSREQESPLGISVIRSLGWLGKITAGVAAGLIACGHWMPRRAASARATVRRRFGQAAWPCWR